MSDISSQPPQGRGARDRLRQRASGNRKLVEAVRRVMADYRKGRGASACMDEIGRLIDTKRAGR